MLSEKIVNQISAEFQLPKSKVKLLYDEWWREASFFIKENDLANIESCKFTDLNIPGFGKLIINLKKSKHLNERFKTKKNKAN